jgi:hypothetical protein
MSDRARFTPAQNQLHRMRHTLRAWTTGQSAISCILDSYSGFQMDVQ